MKRLTKKQFKEIEELYYDYWHKYPTKGVNDFWDSKVFNKLLKELEIEKCDELLTYLFEEL